MKLVVRLMERLLDYRTIMHDENKENRMSCTVNVLVSGKLIKPSIFTECKWSQDSWEPRGQLAIEHFTAQHSSLPYLPTGVLFGAGKEGQRTVGLSALSEAESLAPF